MEELLIVEYIPFRTFKEKINITKEYDHKAKMEIDDNYIYIEMKEMAN